MTLYELSLNGVDNNATSKNNYCMERSDNLISYSCLEHQT